MLVAHFAPAAERDLRAVRSSANDLARIRDAIAALENEDPGLDIRPLSGRPPWRRLRVGDWRILYRPLSQGEASERGARGVLVARIVNRRELERAVRNL